MSEVPEYTLERIFNAPRELVWRAWTDPKYLSEWYGPGVETVIHGFELQPGGAWLNEMRIGENSNYQKMVFVEVDVPSKLVWHHHSADAEWNVADNPMMPDWPTTLLTTALFEDQGDKTLLRFSQIPVDATDAQNAAFAEMMRGMDGGWGKGFALIDELLAAMT